MTIRPERVQHGVALGCLLALATAAFAAEPWVLTEIDKKGAATPAGRHATLAECLHEQKAREETQRAYLRAGNEAGPHDQLPPPVPATSFRCLPETAGFR